jgi:hypothetical protein
MSSLNAAVLFSRGDGASKPVGSSEQALTDVTLSELAAVESLEEPWSESADWDRDESDGSQSSSEEEVGVASAPLSESNALLFYSSESASSAMASDFQVYSRSDFISFYGDELIYLECLDVSLQIQALVRSGSLHIYLSELQSHCQRDHFQCQPSEIFRRQVIIFYNPLKYRGQYLREHLLSHNHKLALSEGAQVVKRWRSDFEHREASPEQLGRKCRSPFWAMVNKQTGNSQVARLVINEGLHTGSASAFQQVQVAKAAFKLDAQPGSCKRKVLDTPIPN